MVAESKVTTNIAPSALKDTFLNLSGETMNPYLIRSNLKMGHFILKVPGKKMSL
jgi:hypothetical protein